MTLHFPPFWQGNSQSDILGDCSSSAWVQGSKSPHQATLPCFFWRSCIMSSLKRGSPGCSFKHLQTLRKLRRFHQGFDFFFTGYVFSEDKTNIKRTDLSKHLETVGIPGVGNPTTCFSVKPKTVSSMLLGHRQQSPAAGIRCWKVWAKPSLGCVAMEIRPYLWMSLGPVPCNVEGGNQIWGWYHTPLYWGATNPGLFSKNHRYISLPQIYCWWKSKGILWSPS